MAENRKQSNAKPNDSADAKAQREPSSGNPTADMFKAFTQNMKAPQVDRDGMINNHRKNLESINDANKMAIEVMKSISNLQTQYIRQTFEDFNTMLRDMTSTPPSQEQWQNQSSRLKEAMSKAIDHSSSIANIVVKSNADIYSKMQNRMTDSFEGLKDVPASASKYKN